VKGVIFIWRVPRGTRVNFFKMVKADLGLVKTRIAPSPTGSPHVGTVYVALFNWALARKNGGKFILRIEDTDRVRLVKSAEGEIIEALEWLGLKWDEGPIRQSERLPIFQDYARKLVEGGHAYYCFCSEERLGKLREESQRKGLSPRYDGKCRRLKPSEARERAKKEPFVIRLKVPKTGQTSFDDLIRGKISFENKLIDDQVLLKSDGYPTYHLAAVVDDHLMGITHVLRGEEWISSTPKLILLCKAFGWKPPKLAHFPLLRGASHAKLSKREGAAGILELRGEGYLPEALINFLALLGWSHPKGKEIFPVEEFVKEFDLTRVSTTAPVFDWEKLNWMNGEYIRQLGVSTLARRVGEYLQTCRGRKVEQELLEKIIPLVRERIKKLGEFEALAGFFFNDVAWTKEELSVEKESMESIAEKLSVAAKLFEGQQTWEAKVLEEQTRSLAAKNGWEAPALFMLLRVAVTGQTVSPPLFESMAVLGKDRSLSRIQGALKIAEQAD